MDELRLYEIKVAEQCEGTISAHSVSAGADMEIKNPLFRKEGAIIFSDFPE